VAGTTISVMFRGCAGSFNGKIWEIIWGSRRGEERWMQKGKEEREVKGEIRRGDDREGR
jgi:hypothetical protein